MFSTYLVFSITVTGVSRGGLQGTPVSQIRLRCVPYCILSAGGDAYA